MLVSKILKSSKYLIIWKGFAFSQKGDESGYHRKDKSTRKVFAEEGSDAGTPNTAGNGRACCPAGPQNITGSFFQRDEVSFGSSRQFETWSFSISTCRTYAGHANQNLLGLSTSNLQLSDIKLNFLGLFQQSSSACSSFETATD